MIDNPVIFYTASVMIIAFALTSLFARNVIYSLLAAVCVFFLGGLFFYCPQRGHDRASGADERDGYRRSADLRLF